MILAAAAFVRFYHIGWSFSNNGVDEGIMLERARLVGEGYSLYKDLPCDQAPLAFLIGSAFHGDVVALRALTAALSVLAIGMCMLASRKQQGYVAMMVTGVLLAVDFSLVRESRLFSLDSLSTSFLAFSLPLFLHFIRRDSRLALLCAGLLVGLSAATKLFGGIALLGMVLFMIAEHVRSAKGDRNIRRTSVNLVLLLASAAAPLVLLMLMLGPSDMLNGMVFNQGHRSLDLEMKLSIPVFFGLNLGYALPLLYARRVWAFSKEARFLLVLTAVLLADFIVQPLVFLHHMVLMSPALALLAGILAGRAFESGKGLPKVTVQSIVSKSSVMEWRSAIAVFLVGVVVCGGLSAFGLAEQDKPSQLVYAEKISEWTSPTDWVISGDPLITSYAQRLTPPDLVNVGTRVYPELTLAQVQDAVIQYDVAVFVLSYRFFEDDMAGLPQFLADHGYEKVSGAYMGEWSRSAIETSENEQMPWVFVRGDIVAAFSLPTEGWSA